MATAEVGRRRRAIAEARGLLHQVLLQRRVRPKTARIYLDASRRLQAWCRLRGFRLTSDQLTRDKAIVAYLNYLFLEGESVATARTAVFGFAFGALLNLKDPGELYLTRLALRGFSVSAPGEQRDPMPWEACLLLHRKLQTLLPDGPIAADALVVCFDGILRPGECLSIRSMDVIPAARATSLPYPPVTVTLAPSKPDDGSEPLPRTKSGSYDDTVIFGDPASHRAQRGFVANLLMIRKQQTPPLRRLFPISVQKFNILVQQAARLAGLTRLRLSPHCARHGGASTDYALGLRTLQAIQRRGRWLAPASVRRYEKAGRLNKQLSLMTAAQLADAQRAGRALANPVSIKRKKGQ